MAKDPAFLFYSKDWIEGTAGLLPAEKGIYIDLLAHQHQKGFLPAGTIRLARIAGMSESEFLPVWDHLKTKFFEFEPGKLINKRLKVEMEERKNKGHKNKIIGLFASLIRQSKISVSQKEDIKKDFKIDEFIPLSTEIATERLTKWFHDRLKSIGNANEDGNKYLKENVFVQETPVVQINEALIPAMMMEFKNRNENYFEDRLVDAPSLRLIAEKIHKWEKLTGQFTDVSNHEKIRFRWGELCDHILSDGHLTRYSISQINKHFQSIIQSYVRNNNSKGVGKSKVSEAGHSGL